MSSVSDAVFKKVNKLDIPRDIRHKTLELYSYIKDGATRRDQRTRYLCFCIRQAYVELNIPEEAPDVSRIASMLSIDNATAAAAIAKRPPFKDGVELKLSVIPLHEMLRSYCKKILSLPDEFINDIVTDFKKLLEHNKSLKNDQSKPLIAAFIYCYSNRNSLKFDIEEFAHQINLETSTIRTRCCKIEKSYLEMLGNDFDT